MKPEEVIKQREDEEIKRENSKLNIDSNITEFEKKTKNKNNLVSVIIRNNTDIKEEIRKKQIPIKKLVKSPDGNYITLCMLTKCKIEVLVYFHTKFDIYDS